MVVRVFSNNNAFLGEGCPKLRRFRPCFQLQSSAAAMLMKAAQSKLGPGSQWAWLGTSASDYVAAVNNHGLKAAFGRMDHCGQAEKVPSFMYLLWSTYVLWAPYSRPSCGVPGESPEYCQKIANAPLFAQSSGSVGD